MNNKVKKHKHTHKYICKSGACYWTPGGWCGCEMACKCGDRNPKFWKKRPLNNKVKKRKHRSWKALVRINKGKIEELFDERVRPFMCQCGCLEGKEYVKVTITEVRPLNNKVDG